MLVFFQLLVQLHSEFKVPIVEFAVAQNLLLFAYQNAFVPFQVAEIYRQYVLMASQLLMCFEFLLEVNEEVGDEPRVDEQKAFLQEGYRAVFVLSVHFPQAVTFGTSIQSYCFYVLLPVLFVNCRRQYFLFLTRNQDQDAFELVCHQKVNRIKQQWPPAQWC